MWSRHARGMPLAMSRGHPERSKLVCFLYSLCVHGVRNKLVTEDIYHVFWRTDSNKLLNDILFSSFMPTSWFYPY